MPASPRFRVRPFRVTDRERNVRKPCLKAWRASSSGCPVSCPAVCRQARQWCANVPRRFWVNENSSSGFRKMRKRGNQCMGRQRSLPCPTGMLSGSISASSSATACHPASFGLPSLFGRADEEAHLSQTFLQSWEARREARSGRFRAPMHCGWRTFPSGRRAAPLPPASTPHKAGAALHGRCPQWPCSVRSRRPGPRASTVSPSTCVSTAGLSTRWEKLCHGTMTTGIAAPSICAWS